jgi:putative ABC transport system substrate-binding protein
VKRRAFITLLGGAAALPLAARAQQGERMRRIGVLMGQAQSDPLGQKRIAAFRQALQDLGWTEGRNLNIEWRWSAGSIERIRDYAAELVALAPELIVANGTPVIAAMKKATSSIPTIFVIVNDPVEQGFVATMAHPGGNSTGFSYLDFSVIGKALAMFKQLAPGVVRAGFMFNPATYPHYDTYLKAFETDSRASPIALTRAAVGSDAEIEAEIGRLGEQPGNGLIVPPDTFTIAHRRTILQAAARYRLPTAVALREFVQDGAVMSYAPDTVDIFRRSAAYVDRILKGETPANLPVQAPTKFELAINLKTARALDLQVPVTLLALADEVIE